jgi:DNA-nicking Smr family endonuclease
MPARLSAKTTQPAIITTTEYNHNMAKLKLDLHDIYNRGQTIDAELNRIIQEAVDKRIKLVEIITGKGSGQLKKRVLRFLNQPHIKRLYHRVEKDDKNFGRIFIHFK